LEAVDDPHQVELDRLVDIDELLLAALASVGGQLAGAIELLAVNLEELAGGEEVVARQAGVGVRAGLLQRQPAEPVGERLFGAGEALLGPRGVGQRLIGGGGTGSPRMFTRCWKRSTCSRSVWSCRRA